MYVTEMPAKMIEDKRKSMRTSAIVHGIIILLAILPFLKTPIEPKEYKQAVLVEFKSGSSSEGSQKVGPKIPDEVSAAAAAAEAEAETKREVKPETKPIETTPPPAVLTSKTEPPLVAKSKVRKVDVKAPQIPAETIPQKTEVKDVPSPTKEVVLKPTKVKKVIVKIERPAKIGTGTSSSSTKTSGTGNGEGESAKTSGGNGTGGDGSSKEGDGKNDGEGKGDKGTGKADKGSGGKGKGDLNGDGVLTRNIVKFPNVKGLVKEAGKITFNVCVDRSGYVSDIEFNPDHSTIKDKDFIEETISRAREYKFEADASAPVRECGRMTFRIEIDEGL